MHLLATTTGVIDGGAVAVDLKQPPGDIVILTAADSELAALATASDTLGLGAKSLRLANLLQLQHNYSVDLYVERTLEHAKLVIVRLLGGRSYWSYGVDRLVELARDRGLKLVLLPGGTDQDPDLAKLSTVDAVSWELFRSRLANGGPDNIRDVLKQAQALLEGTSVPGPALQFEACGLYRGPGAKPGTRGRACIVFYRSVMEGGQTAPVDALLNALEDEQVEASALYVSSLKDVACQHFLGEHFAAYPADVIINATSFAVGNPSRDVLAQQDCVVLQVSFAGTSEEQWIASSAGLAAKDLAMSVVLPELDGRVYAGVASFKADHVWHERSQCRIVTYQPVPDRISHVARLASRWIELRKAPPQARNIAIVLANYPNRDGRIANGVGYDTPASTIAVMQAMAAHGFDCGDIPVSGNALIEALQQGRTNAESRKRSGVTLPVADYLTYFSRLPDRVQSEVTARWGNPAADPFVLDEAFQLPVITFGRVAVCIQPARGYNIDPKQTYHDAALVPPHGYLATYFWLRHAFQAHAVIHNGKHGNLEWLPGKSVALAETCYPAALIGDLPNIYPFIINDPGEGTQAKRRTSAVIVSHLTPPLTRAESYGPLKQLEALMDEYYLASGLDARRLELLKRNILDLTRQSRLDRDAGFAGNDEEDLQKLDAFLCDLKEAQIRDGLHVLGTSPQDRQEADYLVALARMPRGNGEGGDASLTRALADDFGLAFDPLSCDMATAWDGPRPHELAAASSDPWRSFGDTVERLELLATSLISEPLNAVPPGGRSLAVIDWINSSLRPSLAACGPDEIRHLMLALQGKAVPPGPSGAPTRGRPDVLPTGRNFYSLDNRTLPTPAAWTLGKASAEALLTRHLQDTGQHLKTAGLSCWGTANMRTGGDDLAQAMWLMGVKPVWDPGSWRVTGFEVQPLAAIGRPRVDVTLRISGFFRDAFPAQIELLDRAVKAVAALDEDAEDNPLAASLSTSRIFGSKPGSYGAGLQALIDEGGWSSKADLAAAYVTWGAYVYGAHEQGRFDEAEFRQRLAGIEAVIHNQDNREHDLLDSDDYYQFEGGMSAAVETASQRKPKAYHNDHSRAGRPIIRTLDEEVARVMRSRVVNPKWISGVKRHGYKGAFEIAATLDYMFAFAATTGSVKSHHFDLAYDAYVADLETLEFIRDNNPEALREMARRFDEAIRRNLWQPRLNSVHDHLKDLQQ